MLKGININTILIMVLICLLTSGTIWYERHMAYYGEIVLVNPDEETVAIYVEPEDTATRAAAGYLAYAIERAFGVAPDTVTEIEDDGRHYIHIICEEKNSSGEALAVGPDGEITESDQDNKAEIIITTAANAVLPAETDLPVYSVALKTDGVEIRVSGRKDCFGAVKAVTDRWLQKDCGLETEGELRISNRMIKEQLSGLPVELDGEIKILTQNLRYIDDAGGNSVEERALRFEKLVREYQPDLIGTQECTFQWLQLLKDMFSEDYEVFGCSRLGPDSEKEEWNAVLYRKDRFTYLDGDTFWLSNTPGTIASKLNYDGPVRICTWVQLQDSETGKEVLFSNTHLQNGETDYYRELRAKQADILLRQLRKGQNRLANVPGFLTGDFNGVADEPFYSQVTEIYRDAGVTAVDNNSAVDYSFHAYGNAEALVDFCFCSPKTITVLDYRILDDQYGGYVSDHYGVLVTAVVN